MPDEDREVLKADAFGREVAALTPDLLRFARKLSNDPHAADDLVQDTVVRALAAREGFRGEASLATWTHRIMWHLALDRTRRSGRELVVDDVERRWKDDNYSVDPAAVAERAADAGQLRDALIRLPFIYRTALVLHDSLGWTHGEIADRLEITVDTAKQRLRRGRMLLTTALADGPARADALKGVPMHCWDARLLISDYLDRLLEPDQVAMVEAHLHECPTCPPLYAALVDGSQALGAMRDADSTVPDALARRIADVAQNAS